MKTITTDQLAELLSESKGPTFVSFIAETDARLKKTNNPHGLVLKVAQATGTLGAKYENMVNNQLKREDAQKEVTEPSEKFKAQSRNWGENTGRLVENDGKFYLNFSPSRVYVLGYKTIKGKPVLEESIKEFMPKKHDPKSQPTDKPIRVSNYLLSSIVQITYNERTYRIKK